MSFKKNANIFHVQFFGDEAERGWISESAMVPYEGKEKLEAFCKEMSKKYKKDKKWIHKVTGGRRPAWEVAVKSANEAFPMSRAERKQTFTFIYFDPKEKKSKAELLPNGMLSQNKRKFTKRKLGEKDDGPECELELEPPKKRRKKSDSSKVLGANKLANQALTQFMVFCLKRREAILTENPDYNEDKVERQLRDQWDKLDNDQRSKFIPMGSDVQKLSDMLPDDMNSLGSLAEGMC